MKGYELDKLLFQLKVELGNTTKTLAETETYPKIVALFNAQQQASVEPVVKVNFAEVIQNLRTKKDAEMLKRYEEEKDTKIVAYYNGYGCALDDLLKAIKT